MRRKIGKFLLALTAILLCCGIALSAGADGTISVKLKEQSGKTLPKGTFTVTLYRIGEEDPKAAYGWTMTDPFGSLSIQPGMKAEDVRQLAEKALKIIRKKNVKAVASVKAKISKEIRFTGLKTGIYLGEISTDAEGLEIQPFVVALSGREPGKTDFAEVNPKYEYNPQPTETSSKEPGPEPTPTPSTKPFKLTIWYIYWDGRPAAPTHRHIHWPGEKYDVVSPVIPGYTATILRVSGTMPYRDVEYTVIYIPDTAKLIPIDDYNTPLGLGERQMHVGVCFE